MTREPRWIDKLALLLLHEESLALFGGARGMRDEGLLDSALGRPVDKFHYDNVRDLAELAAAYGFGIAKNQGASAVRCGMGRWKKCKYFD